MIHEDDDELGYWKGEKPRPWWRKPAHGGYPGDVGAAHVGLTKMSVRRCHNILGGMDVSSEIQQAALLMHNGFTAEAEEHRRIAGYGGLRGRQ